jgi:murein endopeptidase
MQHGAMHQKALDVQILLKMMKMKAMQVANEVA